MTTLGRLNELTGTVIGGAIRVHRALGPGLLESAYRTCLTHELRELGLAVEEEKAVQIDYQGVVLDCGYRADITVEGQLLVEVKSVRNLDRVHLAQVLTYLRLSKLPLGLLINFNVLRLCDGVQRVASPALMSEQRPPAAGP